jgi:hypothetical protein
MTPMVNFPLANACKGQAEACKFTREQGIAILRILLLYLY